MKRLTALLLLTFLLIGCIPASTKTPPSAPVVDPAFESGSKRWWNDAIFYEIFVRSFYDTDGDGIGDFNGVRQKLDYIESLGANAIWLMPIHPSPSYHGYDVLDYYDVNPDYGTMDDFKNLLAEAQARDIKIIIDLVINHTSSQHPFFVEADSDVNSKYREWYVWSDQPGDHWHQGINGFYFGYFCDCMPDLNFRNPDVTTEIRDVTRYWLEEVGVDGFRVDAAKHLIEEETKLENTESTHDWYTDYYTFYKSLDSDAYAIGEVYGAGAFIATKYSKQLDHVFNFELAGGIMNSVNGESNTGIVSAWKFTLQDITNGDFATFLTNHDQNRVMSVFNGNKEKAKLAAILLLTSPGTPYIYYGEEIGMQGKKPDEDIRLPMQWSDETHAGFTTGLPWRGVDPDFQGVNVADQENDPASLLNLYRTLTGLRTEHSALRTGALTLLDTGNPGVYAVLRHDNQEAFLVLINLTGESITEYELSLSESILSDGVLNLTSMLDSTSPATLEIKDGNFTGYQPLLELSPYQAYIFQIK
jgi:alpha-amylase